ncbi:ATP-binding protein [Duganella aceris]|uniref:histidine kinase n=1 Tax=Duganella aceris TaxID=2703883 RepID=A0ABX0FJQ2_9BURK|nr:ATP-binding protein [Duganella aceris]NGZ84798.1 two-component sensor histidine kinase [Duganella aceris]
MKTIRRQLLLGLLGATLLCVLVAGYSLYRSLRHETNEVADLQLRQLAVALPDEFAPDTALPAAEDPEEEFVLQAWDDAGLPVPMSLSTGAQQLPRYPLNGFRTVTWNGQHWRLYGQTRHGRYVQVAQLMSVRDMLAAHMALRAGAPLLALAAVLSLLIVAVVGRALKPLDRLAQAVAGRSAETLTPLVADDMPPELRPVVLALNGLMRKFDEALTAQRTFVADAAHELRSPLTALKLQLQLVERAGSDEARAVAVAKLHERLDRSTHLVRQLLSLARHEAAPPQERLHQVNLGQMLEAAVADHSALADSRGIDLGVDAPAHVMVQADPDGLQVLLNNLVDNALRYTQQGGRVDLQSAYEQGRPLLRVSDNGPGVAAQHRARLFDRFFRPDGQQAWGCGLGLSIVRNIADNHRAEISLADTEAGRGLSVTVLFPPEAAPDAAPAGRTRETAPA